MKEIEHNDKICDRILAEIRLAQVVVADFTGQRSGVFFEAGYALGLGRHVIWMCREAEFERLREHFDTRQYAHISWTDAEDLHHKLSDRIRATVLNPERGA
jgi:nucleoside 2-deoxyribosyltransferase